MSHSGSSQVRAEEVDLLGTIQRHTPSPAKGADVDSDKGKERMPPPTAQDQDQDRPETRIRKPKSRPISMALQPGQYVPFHPKRRPPADTKLNSVLTYAEGMVAEGNPKQAVACPPNISTNEWLAINAFLYFNRASDFVGVIKDECKCAHMCIGDRYEYLWADGRTIKKPISIPAIDYIDYVMEWCEANFDDTAIFPDYDGAKHHRGFTDIIKATFKRIFRIFGHMEVEHRKALEAKGIAREHDLVFHCLVKFIREYRLMEKKSLAPIAATVERWKTEKKQLEKLTQTLKQ